MNPYSVILKPIVSEKSTEARAAEGKYSFYVHLDAGKEDVKKAINKLFDVNVVSVNTSILRGKMKRRGAHVALSRKRKKAVVTLTSGQTIKLFEDQ